MRAINGAVQRYAKRPIPSDVQALPQFLETELQDISTSLNALADGHLDMLTVAPTKPKDGDFRFAAAGVLGASKGFYGYSDGVWSKF